MVGREVAQSRRDAARAGRRAAGAGRVERRRAAWPRRAGATSRSACMRGEIVGIAGVSGNGQRALAGVIAGTMRGRQRDDHAGSAAAARPAPRAAIGPGIGRIPEDRHHEGSSARCRSPRTWSLETLRDARGRSASASCSSSAMRERARRRRSATTTCAARARTPRSACCPAATSRSCILGRVLELEPRVLLANQPTRGLDVGADRRRASPPARGARARRRRSC